MHSSNFGSYFEYRYLTLAISSIGLAVVLLYACDSIDCANHKIEKASRPFAGFGAVSISSSFRSIATAFGSKTKNYASRPSQQVKRLLTRSLCLAPN